jgi:hypothetical protein
MEFLKKWKSLTWDDLVDWAGEQSVSRGRAYQRDGQVEDLVPDGETHSSVICTRWEKTACISIRSPGWLRAAGRIRAKYLPQIYADERRFSQRPVAGSQ